MSSQPKPVKKTLEVRSFDAALESSLAGLQITSRKPGSETSQVEGAESSVIPLAVQPPPPELVSRLVKFIKKM